MALNVQFEQKLLRILGRALEDPAFVDALMADPQAALQKEGMTLPPTDVAAAKQFVAEMLVAKQEVSSQGEQTFARAVFAPGGRARDLAATHGDVHGDGHGDVSVGSAARLSAMKLNLSKKGTLG